MFNKSGSVILTMFLIYNCALVNSVIANTVPPFEMEPLPDLYALASTYPASSVNYNASPNPQYTSNQFNNFNEPTPSPPPPSYQNGDYSQKPQQSVDQLVTGNYEYGSDIKNALVSVKDNLGLMADTQRLLVNAFKIQQDQYQDIERKLQYNGPPAYSQHNYASPAPQQPVQYQQIPALPPLPYGQPVIPTPTPPTVHRHHKKSRKKSLGKAIRQQRRKLVQRRLAVVSRNSDTARLERRADLALSFIKNGILNALWTALVVACVKLAPLLLFGFKLMFQSVVPLTGLALFRHNRGLFQNNVRDIRDDLDDNKFEFEDEDQDEDEDGVEDEERDIDEEEDISEENDDKRTASYT